MPSRRSVLRGVCAAAALAPLAGCVGSDGTEWAQGLYDPRSVLPVSHRGFVSLDVTQLRARDAPLPGAWRRSLAEADRRVSSVGLADVSRATAVAFGDGDPLRLGGSTALEGSFDPDAVVAEFAAGSAVESRGEVGDHRLYTYEAAALRRALGDRVAGSVPPVTFALAVADTSVVAGALLADAATAADAVEAALGATPAAATPSNVEPVLAPLWTGGPLGRPAVAAAVSFDDWDGVAERIPQTWPTLRALVDDLRALGVGARFVDEETLTDFVFAYDANAVADPEDVRTVVRKLRNQVSRERNVVDVQLVADGRAVRVRTRVDLRTIWRDYRHLLTASWSDVVP